MRASLKSSTSEQALEPPEMRLSSTLVQPKNKTKSPISPKDSGSEQKQWQVPDLPCFVEQSNALVPTESTNNLLQQPLNVILPQKQEPSVEQSKSVSFDRAVLEASVLPPPATPKPSKSVLQDIKSPATNNSLKSLKELTINNRDVEKEYQELDKSLGAYEYVKVPPEMIQNQLQKQIPYATYNNAKHNMKMYKPFVPKQEPIVAQVLKNQAADHTTLELILSLAVSDHFAKQPKPMKRKSMDQQQNEPLVFNSELLMSRESNSMHKNAPPRIKPVSHSMTMRNIREQVNALGEFQEIGSLASVLEPNLMQYLSQPSTANVNYLLLSNISLVLNEIALYYPHCFYSHENHQFDIPMPLVQISSPTIPYNMQIVHQLARNLLTILPMNAISPTLFKLDYWVTHSHLFELIHLLQTMLQKYAANNSEAPLQVFEIVVPRDLVAAQYHAQMPTIIPHQKANNTTEGASPLHVLFETIKQTVLSSSQADSIVTNKNFESVLEQCMMELFSDKVIIDMIAKRTLFQLGKAKK